MLINNQISMVRDDLHITDNIIVDNKALMCIDCKVFKKFMIVKFEMLDR